MKMNMKKLNDMVIALGAPRSNFEKKLLNTTASIRFAMSGSIANKSTTALAVVDTEQMNAIKNSVQMSVGFIRLTAILAAACTVAAML